MEMQAMTDTDMRTMADAVAAVVKAQLAAHRQTVETRFTVIEQRIAAIPAGPKGDAGEQGAKGMDGLQGERGESGPQGLAGERGADGVQGMNGKDGAPGEHGAAGADGVTGPQGAAGEPGVQGPAGPLGAPGPQGDVGYDGPPGLAGKDGRDGRDGKEGAPGRDGMQIDVLDAVDETRNYPRGTVAIYRGGMIRATRTTDPLADGSLERCGWQVLVSGFPEIDVALADDERTVNVEVRGTDGRVTRSAFRVPAIIYREVWRRDDVYARGDVVTWDGNAWHCGVESTTAEPGASPDWRLMVRKGRDRGKA